MRLIETLRKRQAAGKWLEQAESLLAEAWRLHIAGVEAERVVAIAAAGIDAIDQAEAAGSQDRDRIALRRAEALFLLRRPGEALGPAHRAARARPYDVDSRIVHGLVRLALNQLREAVHEYESVLEEFGGDPDATIGRLAVALARGEGGVSGEESEEELGRAAALLMGAWWSAEAMEERLAALEGVAPTEVVALLREAAGRRGGAG